ncbi:MAG: lipoyl(octanoyl) transferase LipB [SAR202 cluster bacterium]|nr:lipoyl(octanoyl) transferase LipB [SAR202 cluster bacterium]
MTTCYVARPGTVGYAEAYGLQKRLAARVAGGGLPGALLLLEHPHVFTLGRRGKMDDILSPPERLLELGVTVHQTDRGGEVTYHGPGQLVGYPIVDVRACGGPVAFVRGIQEALIATLADFGIAGESTDRPTGVWVGDAKIAAIGLHVSRGVSTHGFALNVAPDLSFFSHIVPCGLPDSPVTSMEREAGITDAQRVAESVERHLGRVFGWDMELAALSLLAGEPAPRPAFPARTR